MRARSTRPVLRGTAGLAFAAFLSTSCAALIDADFDAKTTAPELFGGSGPDAGGSANAGGGTPGSGGTKTGTGGGSGAAPSDGGTGTGGMAGASTGGETATGGAGSGGSTATCGEMATALVINEVRGQGGTDYIELYNPTDEVLNLNGFKVSDGENVSAIESGTMLGAGDHLYLQDVDAAVCPIAGGCQTFDFGISASGETVYLLDPDDVVVDSIDYPNESSPGGLDNGETWGRLPDGCLGITYLAPTPDAPNQPSDLR